jgi:hypothetical protein
MVVLDHSFRTYMCTLAREFPYLLPIFFPYQDCEYLVRIRGVQIDERWLTSATRHSTFASHDSADSGVLAFMHLGLRSCKRLGVGYGSPEQQCGYESGRSHGVSVRSKTDSHRTPNGRVFRFYLAPLQVELPQTCEGRNGFRADGDRTDHPQEY